MENRVDGGPVWQEASGLLRLRCLARPERLPQASTSTAPSTPTPAPSATPTPLPTPKPIPSLVRKPLPTATLFSGISLESAAVATNSNELATEDRLDADAV
jgi:hypothetical protein